MHSDKLGHPNPKPSPSASVDHPDYGAARRQRDYDVMTSTEFKKALDENHVILIQWKDLKKLLD
jgi:hypothetical protein